MINRIFRLLEYFQGALFHLIWDIMLGKVHIMKGEAYQVFPDEVM